MPRTRPPYPPEFRAEAVRLARSSGKLVREGPVEETAPASPQSDRPADNGLGTG